MAWFIASEFRTNTQLAHKTMNSKKSLKNKFFSAYNNPSLRSEYENLIIKGLESIILKNKLRIKDL